MDQHGRIELTEQDLVDALLAAEQRDVGGALTVAQLQMATGLNDLQVRLRLRKLIDAGRLDVVRVPATGIDGRHILVPAYRLRAAGEGADGHA